MPTWQTCWNCGNSYSGYDCPFCANRKALEENAERIAREQEESREAFQRAQEESQEEFQRALDEQGAFMAEELRANAEAIEDAVARQIEEQRRAVEKHRWIVANAPKLQAEEKVSRARRLFDGGLTHEALSVAEDAMGQDPENLEAVLVAAAVLRRGRHLREITPYYEKQIKLLGIQPHSGKPAFFLKVLDGLPDEDGLNHDFTNVLASSINGWSAPSAKEAQQLRERLKGRSGALDTSFILRWQARTLQRTIESSGWSAEELKTAKEMTATLRSAGMEVEARQFVTAAAGAAKSLVDHGLAAQLCSVNGLDNWSALTSYVASLTLQSNATGDMRALKSMAEDHIISTDIYTRIAGSVAQRYAPWKRDIENALYQEAAGGLKVSDFSGYGGAIGIATFVILAPLGGFYATSNRLQGFEPILSFGSLFGAFLMGGLAGGAIRRFKISARASSALTSAFARQNGEFAWLGLPQVTPQTYRGASGWIFVLLLIVVMPAYLAGYLSLMDRGGPGFTIAPVATPAASGSARSVNAVRKPPAMVDELISSSIGSPSGISWVGALGNHGAAFSADSASRIEYPKGIAPEGTIEFWIKVDAGYLYDNGALKGNQDTAMIFSTDAEGGDVSWPGATKFLVSRNGDITLWMATAKYDRPPSPTTVAKSTAFGFDQWHAVGFSYGGAGQFIMVDGRIVASAPERTQSMGSAGTHSAPADLPTVGETVSHFWPHHQYEGGFEGILARFRASSRQTDWVLAKGVVQ